MGLFDHFAQKPEKNSGENAPVNPAVLLEIAKIVANGDPAVLAELEACVRSPAEYFASHQEQYEERSVWDAGDLTEIRWLGMVDIFESHNYVCERDWKDEKEDFLSFLQSLEGMKRLDLKLQAEWFSEEGDISAWCAALDEKWKPQQCCVGCIDIDSDSYVIFPCRLAELERLKALAAQLGKRIELAEKM